MGEQHASAFDQPFQWGIIPAAEAEIVLSPAYKGRGLRAFDKWSWEKSGNLFVILILSGLLPI
jgi:hypothetical protein